MASVHGQSIPSGIPPLSGPVRGDVDALTRLRKDAGAARLAGEAEPGSLRARVLEIGVRAESVQHAASAARTALSALGSMEEALLFALEAASEAKSAITAPDADLDVLQKQVDLAISCVDGHAQGACFGGEELFGGGGCIVVGQERLELPVLGSVLIGGSPDAQEGGVEYSQSVASAASGGPSSLEHWADGAALALEAGLGQVRELRATVDGFYSGKVLPAVGAIAVSLANALATETDNENLESATALLAEIRSELATGGGGEAAVGDGKGVLRLL